MAFFATGTWIGIGVGVAVAGTVYGAVEQNRSARGAAMVDRATGAWNARYDEALAAQLDLDTIQNVRTEREEQGVYLSRQQVSYAAAGVLSDSGSALMAQIQNVGRFEQQIQQKWVDAERQQQGLYAKAKAGILGAEGQAISDQAQGRIALVNGAASASGQLISAQRAGVFKGIGK